MGPVTWQFSSAAPGTGRAGTEAHGQQRLRRGSGARAIGGGSGHGVGRSVKGRRREGKNWKSTTPGDRRRLLRSPVVVGAGGAPGESGTRSDGLSDGTRDGCRAEERYR
ncbi:MAG: hypothetical protein JKY05_02975 [SAR324 cluster bacterium]|nr:hypothetical protein [SAR324 cluster bacterium]